jgi:hypothetical protein
MRLAAAVSAAGGLGSLSTALRTPDRSPMMSGACAPRPTGRLPSTTPCGVLGGALRARSKPGCGQLACARHPAELVRRAHDAGVDVGVGRPPGLHEGMDLLHEHRAEPASEVSSRLLRAREDRGHELVRFAGRTGGLIHDVPPAADVLRARVTEAEEALRAR